MGREKERERVIISRLSRQGVHYCLRSAHGATDLAAAVKPAVWRRYFISAFHLRTTESVRRTELRSCMKIKVVVLGSLPLIVLVVCVDVKQH